MTKPDPIHKSKRSFAAIFGLVAIAVQAYPEGAPYAEFKPLATQVLSGLTALFAGWSKAKEQKE